MFRWLRQTDRQTSNGMWPGGELSKEKKIDETRNHSCKSSTSDRPRRRGTPGRYLILPSSTELSLCSEAQIKAVVHREQQSWRRKKPWAVHPRWANILRQVRPTWVGTLFFIFYEIRRSTLLCSTVQYINVNMLRPHVSVASYTCVLFGALRH